MSHNGLLLTLTILIPVMFVVTMAFNGLASGENFLYKSSTGEISAKYYLEVTPSGWTFSIWGFIYTWQALWILYSLVNLFRKNEKGRFYVNPVLMPAAFLGIYIFNLMLNCSWMILFDREIIEAAATVLFLMCLTLYACLFISYRWLNRALDVLIAQDRKIDVWLTRMLVHNGLSMYATWCTIATLLNLAMVLAYRSAHDISQSDACTVSLSILSALILVFLVTDWFFLDKYTRYTFTPYIVLVVALSGSLAKNYTEGARNSIFTVVLLAVAGVAALVKVVLLLWRHFKYTSKGVISTTDGEKV